MTKTADAFDRLADAALAERAENEISDRDRVIRIAKREGATLRALADATGLSRQTIANICGRSSPRVSAARATSTKPKR